VESIDPRPPLVTEPDPTPAEAIAAKSTAPDAASPSEERRASELLIQHLFTHRGRPIQGLDYDVAYRLSEGAVGGDIVDVYHFDNGNVALSIADIAGKGAQASIHAALVKYGLRCFASEGLTAERVLRSLDRAYVENNAFEGIESFATVFVGLLDAGRRSMTYASAGHESAVLCHPHEAPLLLKPTAPLIGVFDDQHHLFRQAVVDVVPGTLLLATTDGLTEARSPTGEFYGVERLVSEVDRLRSLPVSEIIAALLADLERFANGRVRDDIAVLAARIVA
jgi:sigma-B regulation protein RsbU (phosphoserine phosphatase)